MKYKRSVHTSIFFIVALLFLNVPGLFAQELVYQPTNPAFGGNPGNFQWLMQTAEIQNLHTEDRTVDRFARDPLADFEASLQRQILSQLTRQIVRQQFDDEMPEDSIFEFGEFTIELTPGPDGVSIRIFNIMTGDETNITIPNI
jgi:curli production assembly/transport component CsgF